MLLLPPEQPGSPGNPRESSESSGAAIGLAIPPASKVKKKHRRGIALKCILEKVIWSGRLKKADK